MSVWVGLILKQDTPAIAGEHSDLCFVEAEDQSDAVTQIVNNKWDEPWGKRGASRCVILKVFELSNVPPKLLVGPAQHRQKLLDNLGKLSSEATYQEKSSIRSRKISKTPKLRVRRRK